MGIIRIYDIKLDQPLKANWKSGCNADTGDGYTNGMHVYRAIMRVLQIRLSTTGAFKEMNSMIVGNIIGKRLDKGKYKARKTYALERFALSTPSKYHLFSLLEKKNEGLFLC